MALAVLTDVVKRYDSKLIVDHVNFSLQEGEIFGLLGPNGAGKSTTISMICGLLKADSGEIMIDGLSVREKPLEVKKRIGLVPQELALYENMSAAENVSFFGKLYGLRGKLLKERIQEALEFTGLSDRARDKPSTFSGGMKRRLNIACAIMHRPRLIIMDEPTVGIDPQSRNHILESVKTLNKLGSTIIYTSHYMEEVAAVCDRVAIMDKGHIIACGTESELRERVAHEEKIVVKAANITQALINELRQHPRISRVEVVQDAVEMYLPSSQNELQDILFIFAKHEGVIASLNIEEPDLETLFLSLTGRTLRD
ncbi:MULTISPECIES: ABC transporter ATP-binding protein [unclassified Paenibacillus]|jgi:ABC-2 type transport system ATP-binding protein|uniref:ABC transporter ATP-binding protein n=1 Tax=unclassified Paenibacillus TaxID=185978 RepID=UPI0004F5AFCF|nr:MULTISPECIES: ABC transporter ATP-binding protein [unclassified Paenibacillus]AIQ32675.1 antibiotic ABC transporter ATP-binding protein [Paenibacillus sp. FSL P4-0081]OMF24301.1 export ABC transporter ATP-binding protein [Paenibacillus sp. FSL H8-0259]